MEKDRFCEHWWIGECPLYPCFSHCYRISNSGVSIINVCHFLFSCNLDFQHLQVRVLYSLSLSAWKCFLQVVRLDKKMLETRGSEVLVSVILSCWKFVSLLIIGSLYYCSLLSWDSWCYPQEEANITPSLLWYIMCKKGGSMYWKSFSPHVACLLMWFLMWLFYFIAW